MSHAERYRSGGFLIHPAAVLPPDVVDAAVRGMEAVRRGEYDRGQPPERSPWNPGDPTDTLCKIEQPQRASRGIFDLVRRRRIGELAAEATGADWVQVWWVQLLIKPVGVETERTRVNVGWHQDRHYWGCWEEGSELFTAWVALSDVAEDCGPLRFVPGSHRWGAIEGGDFFRGDLDATRSALSLPRGAEWAEEPAVMSAGGLSLHDSYTIHGSGENRSDRPRRSLALHLRTRNSRPVGDLRRDLARYIDDESMCPVIHGA
ncbi:MAG: phytanoyl-CoA dioxygenase family protein [bacterium]|nr:phytanoyl-CoA dioxygenase family protein [bacterium]